ncbi:MAG: hypothetical protein IPH05_16965 [Flavobacteriales bacterium]|jgi:hypothetical protein|nr:hypothetical protein [Flavobacteriales bacterium]MBK6884589.1 hypothetical protein [Flavobacteriales bacterium]MBK7100991.1 hypothetical protein [Flavobacteriales bacterium]MBK7111674.1 hypothetical protein [Flavobacteriales bacterium]MBK7483963.1 hypothetical protein [Flavobacteriales bacterium]
MNRILLYVPFVMLCTLGCTRAVAQGQDTTTKPKDTRPLRDRIWFGGGVGLSFGTVTAVQLDPLIGYKVDKEGKLSTGLGASYWYFRDNRYTPPYDFKAYGYRIFSRYRVIPQAYIHTEFLHMNVEANRFGAFTEVRPRVWVPHLLVGAGYVQSLGGRSSIYLQVLFDLIQDPNSIYFNQGPIFSGGVGVGF